MDFKSQMIELFEKWKKEQDNELDSSYIKTKPNIEKTTVNYQTIKKTFIVDGCINYDGMFISRELDRALWVYGHLADKNIRYFPS